MFGPGLSALLAVVVSQARLNVVAVSASAPEIAVAQQSMMISATFRSDSTTSLPPFRWGAYLTANGVIDQSASMLGAFGPITLGAQEMQTISEAVTVPANVAGLYTLVVRADIDNAIVEYDKLDNDVAAPSPTRIRALAPDIAVVDVRGEEARLRTGDTFHIDFILRNVGETAATVPVDGHIGAEPSISTTDPLIGTQMVTLVAGAMASGTITGHVPSGLLTGDYTVGIVVDPANTVA